MMNSSRFAFTIWFLDKDIDTYALHDREHIFVFAAIGRCLFLTVVAMQIKNINIIEATHQFTPHLAMNQSIQETIVADVG